MTMTIGQLTDHCQQAYNSAIGDDFFPLPWYIAMIWRAETELAIQGWVIEKTLATVSIAGTRELAWPSKTLAIREVRYDSKWLNKVTLKDDTKYDGSEPTGEPDSYAVWENTVILFPTPDISAKSIQLRCYMAPEQLINAVDPLNVPDEYQIQLCDYVLAQMAFKDQNLPLASVYMGMWQQTVERARQQRKRRLRSDKNMVVKDAYFCGSFSHGIW